jgi:hypothetical protein
VEGTRVNAAEEAALREELAARAQDITAKITRGAIRHGLPAGYRFEFTRREGPDWLTDYITTAMGNGRHGTREAEKWFPAQVRGTAPEPPDDGFMIPPGFAEDLRATIAELFGVPAGPFEPGPPPTRRQRLRSKVSDWRERAARRAYKVIAGYWPDNGEDW